MPPGAFVFRASSLIEWLVAAPPVFSLFFVVISRSLSRQEGARKHPIFFGSKSLGFDGISWELMVVGKPQTAPNPGPSPRPGGTHPSASAPCAARLANDTCFLQFHPANLPQPVGQRLSNPQKIARPPPLQFWIELSALKPQILPS
jgi:hypothetical protein